MTAAADPVAEAVARYAVYAVPGAVADDAPAAVELRRRVEEWMAERPAITADARRYGYHATLKAPFRLAAGRTAAELDAAVAAFAAAHAPVVIPPLDLARIGGFRALVPGGPADALSGLADAVVAAFESFRAPLTEDETARRRPDQLTRRQRELLADWGYPFVFDEFRFHITLTDAIGHAPEVDAELSDRFAGILGRDVPVSVLAVCLQERSGADFRLRSLHRLAGTGIRTRPVVPATNPA